MNGCLKINLGFALGGKQDLNYSLNHTGKGYVSLIASMPFLSKLKEETTYEVQLQATDNVLRDIKRLQQLMEDYARLLELRNQYGLVVPDALTFDLNKIKELSGKKNINIFNKFFAAKAGVEIAEAKVLLDALNLALKIEKTRSSIG